MKLMISAFISLVQTDKLACGAEMSLSRIPFEEAKKCLTVSSIPTSLRHALAIYLDKLCGESNWEYLAEQLDISPQEIQVHPIFILCHFFVLFLIGYI